MNVVQQALKILVALAAHQQVKRLQDRQARANERKELLIEDDEGILLHLLAAKRNTAPNRQALLLDRVDQVSLGYVAVAQLTLIAGVLHLLGNAAAFVGNFD